MGARPSGRPASHAAGGSLGPVGRAPRRVLVGVSGSVAAYKAPSLIRRLREEGHEVRTVATSAALRFIGESALAAVSGGAVATGLFDDPAAVEHIRLAEWADLVLVAPASADLLARVRVGRANDLLSATILSTTAPVVLAPAMHTQMWTNPATVDNVTALRGRGVTVIDPDSGRLTGGDHGPGRLPDTERLLTEAMAVLTGELTGELPGELTGQTSGPGPLASRHVVVTAGGTREPLDPVRFLGNRSSGRQGCALAAAAARCGADVTLVQAHVERAVLDGLPRGVRVVEAGTALEMEHAVREAARDADAVVMAAAVADYRPASVAATKIKKAATRSLRSDPGESLTKGEVPGKRPAQAAAGLADDEDAPLSAAPGRVSLELVENPDILAGLVTDPPRPGQVLVGFAAETGDEDGDVLAYGTAKARRKGADLLAVNVVGEGRGFGDVPNAVVVLDSRGHEVARAQGSKAEVARLVVELVVQRLAHRQGAGLAGPGSL